MSQLDELLAHIPMAQLAQRLGAGEGETAKAIQSVLPALLGGLQANATQPEGAQSLLSALGKHDNSLLDGGVDVDQVDTQDGDKIVGHVFGDNRDQVVHQLGGLGQGAGSGLISKLLPVLAPIVLSFLAKKLGAQLPSDQVSGDSTSEGQPAASTDQAGGLSEILGGILGGADPQQGGEGLGGLLGDVLGGRLGGGH